MLMIMVLMLMMFMIMIIKIVMFNIENNVDDHNFDDNCLDDHDVLMLMIIVLMLMMLMIMIIEIVMSNEGCLLRQGRLKFGVQKVLQMNIIWQFVIHFVPSTNNFTTWTIMCGLCDVTNYLI